jgi:hypothetical protein
VRRRRRTRDDPSRGVGVAGFADVVVVISASHICGDPLRPASPRLRSPRRICGDRRVDSKPICTFF